MLSAAPSSEEVLIKWNLIRSSSDSYILWAGIISRWEEWRGKEEGSTVRKPFKEESRGAVFSVKGKENGWVQRRIPWCLHGFEPGSGPMVTSLKEWWTSKGEEMRYNFEMVNSNSAKFHLLCVKLEAGMELKMCERRRVSRNSPLRNRGRWLQLWRLSTFRNENKNKVGGWGKTSR